MILQLRFSIVFVLFISLIGSSILISIPNSSAQEDSAQIPDWIKNVAEWWANDEISENEFLTGIEYLINNNIISISFMPCGIIFQSSNEFIVPSKAVPAWVKNNAKWWSEDLIRDADFINGLEYLINIQAIKIDNKKIHSKVPLEDVRFSSAWEYDIDSLVFVASSFFELYGKYADCFYDPETKYVKWQSLALGLDTNKLDLYEEIAIWNDSQSAVVVYPFFTYTAYAPSGFYDYYNGQCDSCTTTKFAQPIPLYTSSGNAHQALTLLGYSSITDLDIDKDPSILQQFDKVIMLHSEYVTRTMFDAITSHPNVIYLYPNALYAEIEVDYIDETITLIRGHNYPPEDPVSNGFDWEFDNTHPYEFDSDCFDMELYSINDPRSNGGVHWMSNCYPENVFVKHPHLMGLLKIIKDL